MNTHKVPDDALQRISPHFLSLLAWIAAVGGVALIGGNIAGSIIVPGHDWVADTVSDLAAGQYEIIQDVALYGYAAALSALALACAHLHAGGWRWSALTLVLMLLAVCVIVIGARNEYGDGDNEGLVVHIYIVYFLGALFIGAFLLAARMFGDIAGWFVRMSWAAATLWTLGAPVFFMMPTGYDGAWERGLGVVCVIWSTAFARVIHTVGQRAGA